MAKDRTHCILVVLSIVLVLTLIFVLVGVIILLKTEKAKMHQGYHANHRSEAEANWENSAYNLDFLETHEENIPVVSLEDIRRHAAKTIPAKLWVKIVEGTMRMRTVAANLEAFRKWQIMPQYLVDVNNFSSEVSILGQKYPIPIGLSPTASLKSAHPEGDIESAKAAYAKGTILGVSATASSTIEDIMAAVPMVTAWQQIYLFDDRDYTLHYVRRAERAKCKAIIVTVDKPVSVLRYDSMRGLAKFSSTVATNSLNGTIFKSMRRNKATYEELSWLIRQTNLPVIVKGVMNHKEVPKFAEAGVSAIIVSNHGGRAVDEVPASLSVLPAIVEAANNYTLDVYMDGGIRSGADVFKALALGAKMVFIGRPLFWGLAYGGSSGVQKVLDILTQELAATARNSGYPDIMSIKGQVIRA